MRYTLCMSPGLQLKWNSATRAGVSTDFLGSPPDEQFTEVIHPFYTAMYTYDYKYVTIEV